MKFVSPGRAGVADRIVLMPPYNPTADGRIWFVELKAPGKKLRPLQVKFKELVEGLGFQHRVVDSLESLRDYLAEPGMGSLYDRFKDLPLKKTKTDNI